MAFLVMEIDPIVNLMSVILIGILAFIIYRQSVARKKYIIEIVGLQRQSEDQLVCMEQFNEEKDWLIREIHHRVKNNLQIVISLLNTQSAYLSSGEARDAIKNSQHRMFAISLIHQKLYQADNLSSIDIPLYIYELVNYLKEEYSVDDNVNIKMEMVPLNLDVAYAVPLGLILNEAISNTLKYAFPNANAGELSIRLQSDDQINYHLEIADNGIGLPRKFNLDHQNSLGTNLMAGLSSQLRGILEIKDRNGVVVTLKFRQSEALKYNLTTN